MPINAGVEFFVAQKKYLEAKTREEKIAALEEMIRAAPHHKGSENLRAQLTRKLKRLKESKESKASRKELTIPKEGDAQVCIIGLTQSGKSTLLSRLTNAKPEISVHPYTTSKPEVGTLDYGGAKIQMIEIPSSFHSSFMQIVYGSDAIIAIARNADERKGIERIISKIKKPVVWIGAGEDREQIKDRLWKSLGLIRIYTKDVGKKPEPKALVMRKNSTVENAARILHKDFLKDFKFARVWGSSKFPGEKVGLEYELKDKDILEIHKS